MPRATRSTKGDNAVVETATVKTDEDEEHMTDGFEVPATDGVLNRRVVKDPIHDIVEFDSKIWAYIDTKQFQRLRYIKQLGTSYFVWPGASHNRFEHCLGVAYLARLMAEHLQKNQPELGITDRDVRCVELAGLCHDLGHGPWSHVWDSKFIPLAMKDTMWQHEDASELMFDDLVSKNHIQISERDSVFIKALIAGDPDRCRNSLEKLFLFEIVANKRNGIDVDKFDYIMRDGYAIGDKEVSLSKLIRSARVIDNQICYNIKDANQVYELFYTRFSLHKRIYNHKTAKAIEYMVVDALLAADPHMKIAEQIFDPAQYVYLTDEIMLRIEMSKDRELAQSRAIFGRIRCRDLYKCVDYKVFGWEHRKICRERITPEAIVQAARALPGDVPPLSLSEAQHPEAGDDADTGSDAVTEVDIAADLEPHHVIVDLAEMHHGMKERNPLDSVRFYSKRKPQVCAKAGPGDMTTLMPAVFGEVMLRIYAREARFFGLIQAGYREVLRSIPEHLLPYAPPSDAGLPALTPPATEAPTTPRPLAAASSSRSSFTVNAFTTVKKNYAPESPSVQHKRSVRGKRTRAGGDESPSAKRKKTHA